MKSFAEILCESSEYSQVSKVFNSMLQKYKRTSSKMLDELQQLIRDEKDNKLKDAWKKLIRDENLEDEINV